MTGPDTPNPQWTGWHPHGTRDDTLVRWFSVDEGPLAEIICYGDASRDDLLAAVTAADQLPDIVAQRDELKARWHRCLDETDGLIDRRDQLLARNRALWDFVHAYDAAPRLGSTEHRYTIPRTAELEAARAALGDTP